MCIDAPESTTNYRSGLFEVTGVDLPFDLTRNIKRSFVRILELVKIYRQIPRRCAGASFLDQRLLM